MFSREFNFELPGDHPIGRLRLVPAVRFGIRAAALAGLVITTGAASTVALGDIGGLEVLAADPGFGTTPPPPEPRPDPSTCCAR